MRKTPLAVLQEFHRKGQTLEESLGLLAIALSHSGEKGTLLFTVINGDDTQHIALAITPAHTKVSKTPVSRPDCELILSKSDLEKLLAGNLSPVEAYLGGRMRFCGSIELAGRLLRSVASSKECPLGLCLEERIDADHPRKSRVRQSSSGRRRR